MELEGGSGKTGSIALEDLLKDSSNQVATDEIILVEGDPGAGKTTMTKKIVNDWTNGTGQIKHLDSYDLVLHAECREQTKTYKELLASSMADVSKSFQGEDLVLVTLGLRCLIIIDGFDELNANSTQLFKEILNLKKHHNITVIVTTRPEAIGKYYVETNSHQLGTKHIRLIGISKEKREEFVKRYYKGIKDKGLDLSKQGIDGILKYLQRTEHRLSYLWRLPYNLAILAILWTHYPDVVTNITTAPELHWEMHKLYLSKLMERLQNSKMNQHLPISLIERKIQYFIYCMCWESLVGLKNDEIILTEEAYKRLEKTCQEIEMPVEEMVGAFLKRIETSSGVRYSFSHKWEQDYLAGHYFWMRLTSPPPLSSHIQKISKEVHDVLTQNAVSVHVSQNIIRFAEGELKNEGSQATTKKVQAFDVEKVEKGIESVLTMNNVPADMSHDIYRFINERLNRSPQEVTLITDTLKEIHGTSTFEIVKFQNALVSLIGMFYLKSAKIEDATKMEALKLLQQTGVRGRKAWINILNSVKCDEYVAAFISKQQNILEGEIKIDDSSLFAYSSLLQAMKTPMKNAHKVRLWIAIDGDISDNNDFLNQISILQVRVTRIRVTDANFMQYTSMLKALSLPLRDPRHVNVEIQISAETPDITEFVAEVIKQRFNVDAIYLNGVFQNPSPYLPSEDVLNQVFSRCQVEDYKGRVTPRLNLPTSLRELCASVGDSNCYEALKSFLQSRTQQLKGLYVCVKPEGASYNLEPLPDTLPGFFPPELYIPDISSQTDVLNAIKIAERLLPTTGDKAFGHLFFPRMSVSVPLLKELLRGLGTVRVAYRVFVPSSCKPTEIQEQEEINLAAKKLGCLNNVQWGHSFDYNIDNW